MDQKPTDLPDPQTAQLTELFGPVEELVPIDALEAHAEAVTSITSEDDLAAEAALDAAEEHEAPPTKAAKPVKVSRTRISDVEEDHAAAIAALEDPTLTASLTPAQQRELERAEVRDRYAQAPHPRSSCFDAADRTLLGEAAVRDMGAATAKRLARKARRLRDEGQVGR